MCLGLFFQGIVQAEVLPMSNASHPASTGTEWEKEGAVWGQCAGLGQAVGNTGLPWTQEYM